MTYATQAAKFGRIPTVFVEMDMDFCSRRSGVGACTATQTGDDKCYNTYSTCNDIPNFDKTIKTYVFSEQNADLPIGLSTIPLLKSVQFASQEITPGKGLGVRGSVTAKFLDAPFPDTEIDPYWSERTYDTTNSGTFWGKFKARNPYYENRVLRVRRGYLTTVFDWGNFVDSVYVVDKLDGISKNDDVTIVARDILKLADDKKALFPRPSTGQLSADINTSATSITLTPSGVGSTYAASGKVAISGEVMSFTRSGDVLTVTRAQSNTEAANHTLGDTVQQVGIYTNQKIHYVINDLLDTYAGIDSAYIPYSDWVTESTTYLAGVWNTEITEPTGINTLLGELTEQGTCRIWWDEIVQKIQFRAVKPLPEDLQTLSDDNHFLTKSIDAKTDTAQRISTVLVYFAQKKPTEKLDDLKNYEQRVVTSDTDASSALQYGTNTIKKLCSRWFKKTSLGRVNALSDSLLKTYRNPPRILEFNLTPSLQLKVGDLFYANTRKIQSLSGVNENVPMEVIYAQPTDKDDIKYKAQEVSTVIPNTNAKSLIISSNYPDETFDNYNVYDQYVLEFGTPVTGLIITVTVESGVFVSSADVDIAAFITDDRWPSGVTLKLVNDGTIAGRGGDAGYRYVSGTSYSDGEDGGTGLLANHAIEITNNGVIGGGGGGGGNGRTWRITSFHTSHGGQGGGGRCLGYAGATGIFAGPYGTSGTYTNYGLGANGVSYNGDTANGTGGDGGDGGDLGQDGQDGTAGIVPTNSFDSNIPAGVGGAAGDAVHGNSYITWIATGTRYGAIV